MKLCMGCMEKYSDDFDVCPHCGYYEGETAEEAIHMDPNTILQDRYIVGRVIGYGGFGVTYIGWDGKLEKKVAIKEYFPSEFSSRIPGQTALVVFGEEKRKQFYDGLEKFVDEAKRLAKFQNEEGIVKVYDSFTENETAYIIMEYLDGENLKTYLEREKNIPEDKAIEMMMPILNSLENIHKQGIIHRDISPDNVFVTKKGDVKLIDFGASRYATTSHSRSLTVVVKQGYSPEEQYRSRGDQGPHTDVYSLAATMYKMITGKTPPDAMERRSQKEGLNKEILVEPHLVKGTEISVNVENAILNAMNIRIEDRTPDIATFKQELLSDEPVKRRVGKVKKIDVMAWPLWLKIALPTVLCAALVFGALLLTGVISFKSPYTEEIVIPDGYVTVPDVEGITKDEAVKKIESSKLIANVSGTIESEYRDASEIVYQTPNGDSYLPVNSQVNLILSSGVLKKGVVPFVEGESQADAVKKLAEAGLKDPEVEYEFSDSTEKGRVISQSIPYGTEITDDMKITLVVSKGSKGFKMINVVDMKVDKAVEEINKLGLVVETTYREGDSDKVNTVLEQNPKEGTEVTKGSKVKIVVCTKSSVVSVPDVVGLTRSDAEAKIKDSKLKVLVSEDYSDTYESGIVVSQSPDADEGAKEGDTVSIVVSKGSRPAETTRTTQQTTEHTTKKTTNETKKQTTPTPKVLTISLNANGGSVSKSTISVTVGKNYSLPTPTRSYYDFVGWFTDRSGGKQVTSSTVASESDSKTLYAHWSQKSQSEWVLASKAPANAQITAEKWTYDYTSTKSSSNSYEPGWTQYDSSWRWSDYGSWSSWQNSYVSSSDYRDVQTQYINPTYHTEYNYSRWRSKPSGACNVGPYQGNWGGQYCGNYQEHGWGGKLPWNSNQGFDIWWDSQSGILNGGWFNETSRQVQDTAGYTQYRYRDRSKITTYYYRKVESKESTTSVSSGGSISNVKKWVRYIPV